VEKPSGTRGLLPQCGEKAPVSNAFGGSKDLFEDSYSMISGV
jgi:hypothetical protein